jgi:low affinity Fe/Cu permease
LKTPAEGLAAPSSTPSYFNRFANWTARASGKPIAFASAFAVVLIWAVTGPLFGFSDTWQLVINTGTTIVTFWMVFLIQSTQNRDTQALQLKLDELIRATQGAHNTLLDLEHLDEAELDRIRQLYAQLADKAKSSVQPEIKTGVPDVESITTAEQSGLNSAHK